MKSKYKVAAYDCEIKGKEPFQLLFQNHSYKNCGANSSIILTPELDKDGIVRFIDEMTSAKHINPINMMPQDNDFYGFFDDFWGVMKTESDTRGNCYLKDITVNPTKREKGLGSCLLKGGFSIHAKYNPISSIIGEMIPDDIFDIQAQQRLKSFYKRNGFTVKDTIMLKANYPNSKLCFNGRLNKNSIKTQALYDSWKEF